MIICACTYNRRPLVELWLSNLLKHFPQNGRLYIADNGSKDRTVDFLKSVEIDKRITVITYHDKNIGKAKALNQLFDIGVRSNPGKKYMVSIDSDIIVPDNWDKKLLTIFHDFGGTKTQVGWVSPIYEADNNPIPHGLDEIMEMAKKRNDFVDNVCCPGGLIMFPVSMYKKVGGYPIDNVYGGIDGSYLYTCRKGGYRCGFTPRCVVKHLKGGPEYADYEKWKREKQIQLKKHGVFQYKITKGYWD